MNRWVKRIGVVCLIPIGLVLIVSFLLYIPGIQNYALKKVTAYASEATDLFVSIDRVRLSFPLNLTVKGVEVCSASDTLFSLGGASVSIKLLPLFRQEVSVNTIDLQQVKLDTYSLVDGMHLKGTVGRLSVKAEHIWLDRETAILDLVELSDSDLHLEKWEKQKEDTTSSDVRWIVELDKLLVDSLSFSFCSGTDSMRVRTMMPKALLVKGLFDLGRENYVLERLQLSRAELDYDADREKPDAGFDPAHIALTDAHMTVDSIVYNEKGMHLRLTNFQLKERSGLEVLSMSGGVQSDSLALLVPELLLKTPYSEARLLASIPWSSLAENPEGKLSALFSAFIGKEDVLLFSGTHTLPAFVDTYPKRDLKITVGLDGNMKSLNIPQIKLELDSAFALQAFGKIRNVTDSIRRSGEIDFEASSENLDFLLMLVDPQKRPFLNFPRNMRLGGKASLKNRAYTAELLFREGDGRVMFSGDYDLKNEAYNLVLDVDSLEPVHFLPQDSLYWLAGTIETHGQGTDFFSKRTYAELRGKIENIRYGMTSVSAVDCKGSFKEHAFNVSLGSRYPLAEMTLDLSGVLQKNKLEGMLVADVTHLDLQGFHLTENPFSTSCQLFTEFKSDLERAHLLDMTLGNWEMAIENQRYKPKMLTLHAESNSDTTRVSFHTGDLGIVLTGTSDWLSLQKKLDRAKRNVLTQLERDSMVNVEVLRPDLPEMLLTVHARKDNPIYNVLQYFFNLSFAGLDLQASVSPGEGFCLDGGIYTIIRDSMLIDTVRMAVRQDTLGLLYSADIIKKKYLTQEAFSGGIFGKVRADYVDAELYFRDQRGKVGLNLGLKANKIKEGIRVTLFPEHPTLFSHPFTLNEHNYIDIKDKKNIDADLKLTGENNASFWIHSVSGEGKMEELHAELSQIDLGLISKGFSFMPSLKGLMNVDFQYAPMDSSYMLVMDVNIDDLYYQGGRVGELMFNGVFLPLDERNSQIDVHLYRDRKEFGVMTAFYTSGKKNRIDGNMELMELPLEMFSPFIPDKMARLAGVLRGSMAIQGTFDAPLLNGSLQADSASVYVAAATSTFRLDDKALMIKDNLLTFNKYKLYASGDNPFVLDGTIDLNDPEKMMADLKMSANNLQLLNVKRNRESLVYGKLFVNLNSTLKGPLNALKMRGNLRLLGNTDVTYVMAESPLMVQDRLEGLVTFTSFADTLFSRRRRPMGAIPSGDLDMLLTIQIDPAVKMNVDLTPDRSSYVQLEGGGELAFQYTPLGDMLLNGRYTLTGGTVKYELPIVSAKNFTVNEGSYVEWSGDMMNPRFNLTATKRIRTSVAPEGQSSRLVNFDVGIKVQQTFENMALDFTLEAPEDMTMQNDLVAKGVDERRKLAVGLLVTGMYVDKNNTGTGMNMGAALNSFLQSEINSIAGSALKTVDISFGMDSYESEQGSRTDYSFSFAKRFYNDRIRIVVGGRLSAGENADEAQSDNFIDNVSIEYRLDKGGSRYVKLFHNKNYESLLEGEIIETGVGIVLKRRMARFSDLFDFRKQKVKLVTEEEEK
ncbi:MAG: translocation/assembly module TamB domain-containing protein [Massilibacteroides sp.]|nr:translocation/assembly module TamB domain-containing protein [Massilibacteroides sp.]MDD3063044.1 translocation/assembly module TamB domain-containing protein [Massilibacteroides sp.]MDD4114179.1 translocation/assembly module TamB domain-containing protein [Massilibacteroides sp.]MDD4660553.1 translocation/assembly module TamB domain-containing protein [Massilibacteroides sp.]